MRAIQRDPLLAAFARTVARAPDLPLVLSPRRRATAEEVDRAAGALAHRLQAEGVCPGDLVALAAPNGPAFLAGLLAVRRVGAAALLTDVRAPDEARRRPARELAAGWLVAAALAWAEGPRDWTVEALPGSRPQRSGIGVVKLTSGSTGTARGIATPVEALLADDEALTASMGILPGDRLLAAIPLSHSYGLSSLAIPALVRGNPLVVPEGEGPFAPILAARDAEATVFPTVPAYLDAIVRLAEPPPPPSSLRLVLTAGAPLGAATSARFRERFGLPVHVFYGSSESGGICYDREGGAAERGTVGAPVAGVTVELAPEEAGEGIVPGAGRVVVAGPAVAAGYLPEPDSRLARGRFATADLAIWQGGELAMVGRLDDTINVKGKKVNPREVERVLAALPGVDDARVLGVPGPDRGEAVVRAVVACPPGALTREQILAWCRAHLADHQVPRSVVLVAALPFTERGKLDRAALAALDTE